MRCLHAVVFNSKHKCHISSMTGWKVHQSRQIKNVWHSCPILIRIKDVPCRTHPWLSCFEAEKVSAMIISHLESEAVFDETAVGPYVIRSSLLVELKSYAVVEGGDFTGSYWGVGFVRWILCFVLPYLSLLILDSSVLSDLNLVRCWSLERLRLFRTLIFHSFKERFRD